MTNILILPEEANSYRAVYGDKESTGHTPGQALDSLRSQLTEDEAGTLVIVQNFKPDRFFDAARQERLAELKQLRDAGTLTAEDEGELEGLIKAELRGATERAKAIASAAVGPKISPPPKIFSLPPPFLEEPYLSRVAEECIAHKSRVERMISLMVHSTTVAEDIVAEAIRRVYAHAKLHGAEKEIKNVAAMLYVAARRLVIDLQREKLIADRVKTVNWDSLEGDDLPNLADESAAAEIERHIEADEMRELVLRGATTAERMLFEMWFERDMTPAEISQRLGISTITVRSRMAKLISKMRSTIEDVA